MQAAIYAPAGLELTPDERAFFSDCDPVGYIVFRRNIESREQLRALTDELRGLHGRDDLPILIDQEGGRVARMRPPEWPAFPAGEAFARLYEKAPMSAIEAARANAAAIAVLLAEVGSERRLPAGPRRSPARRHRHRRRPGAGLRADAGRGARAGVARRAGLGRGRRGDQAYAGARPRSASTATRSCRWSAPRSRSWRWTSSPSGP